MYFSDVGHIKGDQNVVADCFSRPPLSVMRDQCVLPAIDVAQPKALELQTFKDVKNKI